MQKTTGVCLVALATLAMGLQPHLAAAPETRTKPKQGAYTLTVLDAGVPVDGSVAWHVSDNDVVAGNVGQGDYGFAWSDATGMVVLRLGGSFSQVSGVSPNGIVTGAGALAGDAEFRGFVWTAADGLTDVGSLGGIDTFPQSANSLGLVAGYSTLPGGRMHAFVWTRDEGITDIDPASTEDSGARWVSESGLVVGSTFTADGERIFTWSKTAGKTEIPALSASMRPDYLSRTDLLTGTFVNDDGTIGTYFWSKATGTLDIGSLGGSEIFPSAISDAGMVVGSAYTPAGDLHAFTWTLEDGLVDLGTLGGTQSQAKSVNTTGLVTGSSTTAEGREHAFVWSAANGLVDLGTLGGGSSGEFVNDRNEVMGVTGTKGNQGTHAFVWTEAAGMIEMPSLGRFDAVFAANRTGAFAGMTSEKKSIDAHHASLWRPASGR